MKVLHVTNSLTHDLIVLLYGMLYAYSICMNATKQTIYVKKISLKALNALVARGYIVVIQ